MDMIIIFSWLVISFVVACVASSIKRSFFGYLLLSLLLSPLIGFIVLAIRGKPEKEDMNAKKDKMLDSKKHIFFCKKCGKLYSAYTSAGKKMICSECNLPFYETKISFDEWKTYPPEKQQHLRDQFLKGNYLRHAEQAVEFDHDAPREMSAPDEIRKYKELLDAGAITQEEYDAKKAQLLGLQ